MNIIHKPTNALYKALPEGLIVLRHKAEEYVYINDIKGFARTLEAHTGHKVHYKPAPCLYFYNFWLGEKILKTINHENNPHPTL